MCAVVVVRIVKLIFIFHAAALLRAHLKGLHSALVQKRNIKKKERRIRIIKGTYMNAGYSFGGKSSEFYTKIVRAATPFLRTRGTRALVFD